VYVPFAGGTLSMASTEEDAFGPAEAAVLQRFAPVADEAHRRLQDLLERRRLEQELIRTERLRAVAELSAGVSHNLNNLLTAIMLPAEMLQKTVEDPEARELVDTIASAAKRAADLVRKLHASARAGPDENVGPVVVAEAIARVLRATQSRWQQATAAGGQGVRVVTDLEDVVPIRGTVVGLDDALTNLIGNAIEAMPAGGTLTLRARPDGEWVRVDCSDTGAGMDEETRRRVFEPFFTTKGNVGAGLGLSVVHRTVARWGGRIEVESAVGAGTTFSLFLPPWSEPVRSGVAGPTARRGP